MNNRILFACSALVAVTVASCSSPPPKPKAERLYFRTELMGENEVPPVDTPAVGAATAILNLTSGELTWSVTFSGTSGPATAAHFHGPADAGVNAGVQINLGTAGLTSPLKGAAKLSAEQQQQLLDGKWYVNVHTAKHPNGEIRGQVELYPTSDL